MLQRSQIKKIVFAVVALVIVAFLFGFSWQKQNGTKTYHSDLGFSFDYPDSLFVSVDPDNFARLLILPNSLKTNKDELPRAIIISAPENNPPMTPLEWLSGPDSGYDVADGYEKLDIDGQEAISMEKRHWILVNTPDNRRMISIASLADPNSEKSLFEEMKIVANTLRFNR